MPIACAKTNFSLLLLRPCSNFSYTNQGKNSYYYLGLIIFQTNFLLYYLCIYCIHSALLLHLFTFVFILHILQCIYCVHSPALHFIYYVHSSRSLIYLS